MGCPTLSYTNDHEPAHVHVHTGSGVVVLNIADATLRRASNAKIADVRKAQHIVRENQEKLQKAWDNLHDA